MKNAIDSLFHNPRWRIEEFVRQDGDEEIVDPDLFQVSVVTPRGTGPKAFGATLIAKQFADDRRLLAMAIRSARAAAYEFRKHNKAPPWMA